MKKGSVIVIALVSLIIITSCSSSRSLIPKAVNTVKTVSFKELNLTNKDYSILDRVEVSATLLVDISPNSYTIHDEANSFRLLYTKSKDNITLTNYEGVIRAGYLAQDYQTVDLESPEDIVRRLAIYRLINLVKEQGGDGIIEPIISTNIEEKKTSWNNSTVILNTTVSGKVIVLKTSK
ncbi:MAG: hypothetical protein U0L22_07965 [Bacteroidales bacterium]|jgi:hypothetical protein|nr:hypothetical protein [Bacteroidales bacterium]MEE1143550.1 hypothetical protein [Bacteroidales bacterium]